MSARPAPRSRPASRPVRGRRAAPPRLTVVGRGKVGRSLGLSARRAGWQVRVLPGRDTPRRAILDGLVVFAVRDAALAETAARLAPWVRARAVAVHVSGALGPEALAALAVPVGQLHPLLSFSGPPPRAPRLAALAGPPPRTGRVAAIGFALVAGDAAATRAARRLCRALGLRAVDGQSVDRALYHAAAALVANGASALLVHGAALLARAGFPARAAPAALAALLASVAANTARLGPTAALTGPVRRGDTATVARHLAALAKAGPARSVADERATSSATRELYRAVARAQLPLARALGEASPADLRALHALLEPAPRAGAARRAAAAPRRPGKPPRA